MDFILAASQAVGSSDLFWQANDSYQFKQTATASNYNHPNFLIFPL
jgi:hypothetical protein